MTKCDQCSGIACGDECDGKSHATTRAQMTNEKDREIARIIRSECFVDISQTERPCIEWDLDTAANVIAKYRAEAVKAEREALRAIDAWWRLPNAQRTIEAIEPAMRLVVSILSDDQETPAEDAPEREETLQEYLDRQDGADIDLECGYR